MPTIANATVCLHLYSEPQAGGEEGKKWAKFSGYSCDSIKEGADRVKKFSVWQGFVRGLQAEWLIQDGKKGTLVAVAGTIRISSYKNKEGEMKPIGEFTNVTSCVILDRNTEAAEQPVPPAVNKTPKVPVKKDVPEEEPPF